MTRRSIGFWEEYDNGPKLEYYRTIPALRDYLIVSHRERRISVHFRTPYGAWSPRVASKGERVEVSSLEAMRRVYIPPA